MAYQAESHSRFDAPEVHFGLSPFPNMGEIHPDSRLHPSRHPHQSSTIHLQDYNAAAKVGIIVELEKRSRHRCVPLRNISSAPRSTPPPVCRVPLTSTETQLAFITENSCNIDRISVILIFFPLSDKEEGKRKKSKSKVDCCGFPLSIFFIVVNEFCERFSYYGMKAVLVLYFRYFLQWDDDLATTIYHTFVALCYLTPILGAIVADSWLGKFKTIVYLSVVYTIGQAILAVSAIHDITDLDHNGKPDSMAFHVALSMVGLSLIALGTGGIKPCVSAFGGDQFEDQQEKQRSTFFSIFYISINAGSLLSTLITPILRAQECGINSQQKCYPLAFGVPAVLMAVALVVFIMGSNMYTKAAPKGNIMLEVCRCIGFAIKNRFQHRSKRYPKREHWMDWANEKYDKLLIAQVKIVLKVLFLYIPLPMFWALFDQQGSRWTLQATTMDGNFGAFKVEPDQMQIVNPLLILAMVPLVDSVVYPLTKKCGLNFTPLRRMTVGMFMAGLAFIAAALLQIQIDKTLPTFPSASQSQVKFLNLENSVLPVTVDGATYSIQPFQSTDDYLMFNENTVTIAVGSRPPVTETLLKGERQTILLTSTGIKGRNRDVNAKPEQGNNEIRLVNGFEAEVNITAGSKDLGFIPQFGFSNYTQLPEGTSTFLISNRMGQICEYSQSLGFGSSYTLLIPGDFSFGPECAKTIRPIEDIKPNTVHMAWQIPQYFLMTTGEVVFSVTGLEFSYSQAPSNMKSVLQAGWLLTVAVGNIIVLIVAEAGQLPDQWAEYVLFASLLICVCVIFSIMAYFYTYIDPMEIEAQFAEGGPQDKEEKSKNLSMTDVIPASEDKKSEVKQSRI
ncbi:solute carrier family 15 member 1b [Electrophorus electricus]|uniref:solute carrier family 15 member 1b n=1 Tax=Electrophorus electricus TaxID=8005 RepID=UPI0015D05B1A|nr:solute carrier family 15 member 1b [Electrophorus electricus]